MPASRRLLTGPPRFFEPYGQRTVLLAPRLHLLAHGTRARHQCDQPHALLQAQSQRALTIGLTVGHHAAYPVESEGQTCLNRYGGLGTVTGIPIAQAHAQRQAITAHAETQEHLLEIIMPIFAVPIGRPRWDKYFDWAGLLLIGVVEGERRRILMEPWGHEGIDLQGVEGDRPKHAIEIHGKQRVEDLPQPVIMERGALEPGLE